MHPPGQVDRLGCGVDEMMEPTRSSGCGVIDEPSGPSDLVAEVAAQIGRGTEVDLAAEQLAERELEFGDAQQARYASGLELD